MQTFNLRTCRSFCLVPDKNETLNDKHPLKKLIRREEEAKIHNLIADIPFKDIAKIAAAIKEQKDDPETKKEA